MTTLSAPFTSSRLRGRFLLNFLSNISIGWKMSLMALILVLGLVGVVIASVVNFQTMRYHVYNLYDFMLIPIDSIDKANTALVDIQYQIQNLHAEELSAAGQSQALESIQQGEANIEKTMTRYDTEWLTTGSPEFTAVLRDAGHLDLQQQEVAILEAYHTSYNEYQTARDAYLASVEAGHPKTDLAYATNEKIAAVRSNLEQLIEVNIQFAEVSDKAALAAYNHALVTMGSVLATSLVLGLVISYLIVVSIISRLGELTSSATAMQQGNLNQTVAAFGRDEISLLGSTFNAMAGQLKDLFNSLEQRVADRTKDLATVAEVGTATATILESKRLLQEVVDLIKDRFNLYHAHIYLLDEQGENLVLAAGAGEPGRIMVAEGRSIPLDREQSLVSRAARERKGVTVNDVTQAPDFLPNPLLPDTRSELAVPMVVGGNLIGVADLQSNTVGRFTDADISVGTTLASLVATSIQNVRQFEKSRAQAELETLVNMIGQKIQRTTSVEETLQTAVRELGTVIGASRVRACIGGRKEGGLDASQN
jgi:nitrate/nitrite-specific signal transduction histidine kinase